MTTRGAVPEDDVGAALGELERKLKELEEELSAIPPAPAAVAAVAPAAAAAPPPPAPPVAVAPPPPAAAAAPVPTAPPASGPRLDELARRREELGQAAHGFLAACDRMMAALRAAAATPAPPPPAPEVPAPGAAPASIVAPAPAPWAAAPAVAAASLDDTVLHGTITVDAGPFTEITTLSAFEQAMKGVPGVGSVQFRGFEGSCAFIEVTLDRPVALGAALRRTAPVAFTLTQAGPSRVSIAVEP